MKKIKIYSSINLNKNSGIIALNFEEKDSVEISYHLDKVYAIATRGSLHCAPLAHQHLNTRKNGLVRFSIGCFNSIEDIDIAINALSEISISK